MTSLPKGFIAVTIWVGFLLLSLTIPMTRTLTGYSGPATGAPTHFVVTEYAFFLFAIVLIVNLVRLHPIAIWLTVGFLALSAVSALLRLPTLLSSGAITVQLISAVFGSALNAIGVWYLSRSSFQGVAARLRAERAKEAIRRDAEVQSRRVPGA